MRKPTFIIDGAKFDSVEGFYDQFGMVVLGGECWGRNLDALSDVLFGGMGAPENGFILVWKNHTKSRLDLSAPSPQGPSYFEAIIDIIQEKTGVHGVEIIFLD